MVYSEPRHNRAGALIMEENNMKIPLSPIKMQAFHAAECNQAFFDWLLAEYAQDKRFETLGAAVSLLHAAPRESDLSEEVCERILWEVGLVDKDAEPDPYNLPDYKRMALFDIDVEKYAADIADEYQYYLQVLAEGQGQTA